MKMLDAVVSEKLGFRYGEPQRLDQQSLAVVLPILRQTTIPRLYTTFPECQEKVLIFDTGKIDRMEAHNQTDQNVFMRSGTLFKGATQERALQQSVVLYPQEKVGIAVRCVHASRGINPSSKVSYGGVTPLDFDQKIYDHEYNPANQSVYWSSVTETTKMFSNLTGKKPVGKKHVSNFPRGRGQSMGGHIKSSYTSGVDSGMQKMSSFHDGLHDAPDMEAAPIASVFAEGMMGGSDYAPGEDDLASHLDDFATSFDSLLSKLELQKNQVGLGLITQDGVQTIEFFDHEHSWKALHDSAIKRIGSHVVSKADPSVFEYKPEHAKAQINKILEMDWKTKKIWEHKPSNGEAHVCITSLSADRYVGELVEINKVLLHLVILKRAA